MFCNGCKLLHESNFQLTTLSTYCTHKTNRCAVDFILRLRLQLEFEVVGGGGSATHVAVDDVALLAHPCDSEGLFVVGPDFTIKV